MLTYLPNVGLKYLFITFAAGAAVMQLYARFKVRNGVWLGIPDLLSSALVILLGSATLNTVMAVVMKVGK